MMIGFLNIYGFLQWPIAGLACKTGSNLGEPFSDFLLFLPVKANKRLRRCQFGTTKRAPSPSAWVCYFGGFLTDYLEWAMRFELTTPTLARLCSTPELRPHHRWLLLNSEAIYAPLSAV
jgi:hypothetical protein